MRPLLLAYILSAVWTPAVALHVRVAAFVDLPAAPTRLAITPDGRELYILIPSSRTVLVMQTASRRLTHKVEIGESPKAVVAAPNGSQVFVGCRDAVVVISTADKRTITVPSGPVEDLTVTDDSHLVYLAMGQHGVQKMDVPTRRIETFNRLALAMAVALMPGERFLYVNYQRGGPGGRMGHDAIGKFDARTGTFLRSITGLANVGDRLVISRDRRFLWASGLDACFSRAYDHIGCPVVPAGIVNVVDLWTETLVKRIPWIGGSFPTDLTFSPDGRVLAMSGGAPRFYDTRTFEIAAALPEMLTESLVFSPDGLRAYATVLERQGYSRPAHPQVAILAIKH